MAVAKANMEGYKGSESSRQRKFHVTFASGNESSQERKFQGAKVPRSESSWERKYVGTKVPVTCYSNGTACLSGN